MKSILKTYVLNGHMLILLVLILISLTYFYPSLVGKRLQQPDIKAWRSMSRELRIHKYKTGEEALWTNRVFSGMPTYMISTPNYPGNLTGKILDFYKKITYPQGCK